MSSITYRGFQIGGAGRDARLRGFRGLFARNLAANAPDLPRYHGALVGASFELTKRPRIEFAVDKDKYLEAMSAFEPLVDTEDEAVWVVDGVGTFSLFCRPTRCEIPEDELAKYGYARSFVEFEATDPALYGSEVQITLNPQAPAEGLSYPVTYPKQYGAAGTSGETFSNTGEWETWPVFQINGGSGTMTDPSIIAPTLNMKLALTANGGVSILPGQVLEISTHPRDRYVRFTTGASRYGKLSSDSEFFALPKGDTELRFQASGDTTGADVDVIARPAWI